MKKRFEQAARNPHPSLVPAQAIPVGRGVTGGSTRSRSGLRAAAGGNACENLTGLAQQMCYAAVYHI